MSANLPAKSRPTTHSSPAKSASSPASSPQRVQVQEASGRLDNSALLIKRLKEAYGYYIFPLSHLLLSIHIEYKDTHTLCSCMKIVITTHKNTQYRHTMPDSAARYLVDIHTRCGLQKVHERWMYLIFNLVCAHAHIYAFIHTSAIRWRPPRSILHYTYQCVPNALFYHCPLALSFALLSLLALDGVEIGGRGPEYMRMFAFYKKL